MDEDALSTLKTDVHFLEYEGGAFFFPEGIKKWCKSLGVHILNVDEEGNLFVLRNDCTAWEAIPFEKGNVSKLKAVN